MDKKAVDLIILSGRIFTGDPARPLAEAVGIREDRIVAVGSNEDVMRHRSGETRVVELPDSLVTPGLVDAHLHFVNLGFYLLRLELRSLDSLEACRDRVRQAAASRKPGEWILGRGWNEHFWKEKREPTARDLDEVAPDHPVMLVRVCGHSLWVNSAALKAVGIGRETPGLPGGRIEKDPATGEPTGLLREYKRWMEQRIPSPALKERKEAALLAQREALRFGVTGVHSCETLEQWEALEALEEEGKLKVRVHHLLPPDELEAARAAGIGPGQGSDRLWFGQVKLFADGTLGSGTALLDEPYEDDPGNRGIAVLPPAELADRIERAYAFGSGVGIHAIGDRGVGNALEAIAAARKRFPGPWRDRIEHVQLFHVPDLELFRRLGVVGSVQPAHLLTDRPVAEKRWGIERCRRAYAWKSLLRAGIPLQFGSDAPVEAINPLQGFHAAVDRQAPCSPAGEPWNPAERLTLEEVIHAFTAVPAWVSRKEDRLGILAPGKKADLAVFGQDLFALPGDQWPSVGVEMTIVDGEVVYEKGTRP
jgi:predicted amidohydrolase YtcJ